MTVAGYVPNVGHRAHLPIREGQFRRCWTTTAAGEDIPNGPYFAELPQPAPGVPEHVQVETCNRHETAVLRECDQSSQSFSRAPPAQPIGRIEQLPVRTRSRSGEWGGPRASALRAAVPVFVQLVGLGVGPA